MSLIQSMCLVACMLEFDDLYMLCCLDSVVDACMFYVFFMEK